MPKPLALTAKKLAEKLLALPEEYHDLPVLFMNDCWLYPVRDFTLQSGNEYGYQSEHDYVIELHVRLL